ncbi:AAA family ATPase [Scytonema sp. UIC 10036]|uniref:hybrid sensor histidine kinase/response regulator n=1 Tax=Scytonema sp. UIC 10036 TaxID=2304196 RepID=UPI0012DA3EBE|nr:hybrid sensor histidine kinase/response regulator [Scytonema sp. UIC 10036]MUG98325.1 AAA family ATPase [Scytonema sp. UIC 10036]
MSITIAGYNLIEVLYDGTTTCVYRALREPEQTSVIVKTLKAEYPTIQQLTQLKHEYQILQSLDIQGIVKPLALENYQNGLALILTDLAGETLKNFINSQIVDLSNFLNIAIQLANILSQLHQNNIIHKDIKPQNILINLQTGQVKIIDFSISSCLSKESQNPSDPNLLEGTLAYMSPEQTGRMNRSIDYRSDFYSLGITFYEMLTGQLPFQVQGSLELVHCHIAKTPVPPKEINSNIPPVVSDIVMKLLAKTAEERYQNALGLKADLEECLQQLQASGIIADFSIGQLDLYSQFIIPQKLYGREKEVAILMNAFERVSLGATEMMLVSGYSGIGKSCLVNEVHKPIVRQRGYFISGKFDQFKRNIPYASLIQAFQELIRQLLTESSEQIANWQAKLLVALGDNAQVIIDVIPEVERIMGPQPEVPQLGPTESQNRFNRLFQQFIHVFCKPEHPLVVFLDDLQWADSASLKLIQLLANDPDSQYLLLISAYRDNEVNATHPLILTLEEIQKSGAVINNILLQPLQISHVNQLVSDTVHTNLEKSESLAGLVYNKTQGNPFFLTQLLKSLYQDNLLSFNFSEGFWQWDIHRLQNIDITDNVIELMVSQIQKLLPITQNVLKLAACIGDKFTLEVLATVNKKSQSETATDLWEALQAGLIFPLNNSYKIPLIFGQKEINNEDYQVEKILNNAEQTIIYKFLHDRVQQAAYSLILDEQKKGTHLKIGQLLLQKATPEERKENIFTIVNQLNYGTELLTSESEKYELAHLNLIAGEKAKAATAYESAIRYLKLGLELLTANSWQNQYSLTLTLYESAIETAYLNGDFEQIEKWGTVVLQQAKTPIDKMKVYEVKIEAYMAQLRPLEAIKVGLQALELLGVGLPESPSLSDIEQTLAKTAASLAGKNIEDLINLPLMTDVDKLVAMRMLRSMGSSTYQSSPTLFPLVACEQVNLSIKYGNASFSAYGYACYSVILKEIVQDIESAYKFGQLALSLVERFNALELKPSVFFGAVACTMYGKVHARETLPLLQDAYSSGVENGHFEYSGYAAMQKCQYSYFLGEELTKIEREMAITSDALAQLKQENALSWNQIFQQSVLILLQPSKNPCHLVGEVYNEDKSLPFLKEANSRTALHYFYINKLILGYLFEQYNQALENAYQAEEYLDGVKGFLVVPVFHFYDSLARLAVYSSLPQSQQQDLLSRVINSQGKMRKWADHAPMNFQHKYELVEAERHRVLDEKIEAAEMYDRAIALAKDNDYINEEALAHELAAKFYLSWGRQTIARTYMTNAYHAYSRWGAIAKIKDLEIRYPQLITISPAQKLETNYPEINRASTRISRTDSLDLMTVMKASQALSGEIVLSKFLANLMRILIENAGAEKGFLILETAGKLNIEASGSVEQDEINVERALPVDNIQQLPISVINYVQRTQNHVVLNDATNENVFNLDNYILKQKPKSILCMPIVYQGKLIGILYLENNLTTGAFTPQRLQVLQLLSSQAAISIENARLYHDLEEYNCTLEVRVKERTLELQAKNLQLQQEIRDRQRAEELAETASRAKSQFLASMSHELRTPLNGILGYAQILNKNKTFTAEQKNGINIIHQCGEHLLTLINDILDISKIEAGKLELGPTEFSLPEFLENIVQICQIRSEQKGIALVYNQLSPVPKVVRADAKRLRQVLINLLSNAVKFTEKGSVKFQVGYHEGKLRFQVEDTGIGIAEEQLEEIFLPFKQVGEDSRKTEGTGLGLAISRQLVEMMGGELKVKSTLGKGSVFWLDLDLPEVAYSMNVKKVVERNIIGFVGDRKKILVVDDKWANRSVLVNLLQPLGFEVLEATDGLDCLNKALEFKPDLIFMDLVMTVMDGFEATRRLRMLPNFKEVKVIAISASVFDFEQKQSLEVGCNDFLPKPLLVAELLEKLRIHLGLEWIYEEKENELKEQKDVNLEAKSQNLQLISPPVEEIAILLDLAMKGDLRSIDQKATQLEDLDEQLLPFATHLHKLAKEFKGKQIVDFIKQYSQFAGNK